MNNKDSHIDYWVACSGGVDSVVLANLFSLMGRSFGILHCNFHLRGEDSNNDEVFVRDLAAHLEVPIQVKSFDVEAYIAANGGNIQLAARSLRYEWFEEIKDRTKAIIVLGHHKDDQIETFLLQLRRGGKVNGLAAMATFNNEYLRPLLKYEKEEIYSLALNNNWEWREDASNKKSDYKRNLYRNELIPLLKEWDFNLNDIIDLVGGFQILVSYFDSIFWDFRKIDGFEKISFDLWSSLSLWTKQDLLKKMNLTAFSIKEIDKLLSSTKGVHIDRKNCTIWNEGTHFIICRDKNVFFTNDLYIEKVNKSQMDFDGKSIYLDGDKVGSDLKIRKWKSGDKFQPLGMKGRKLVSDFLKDKKVPAFKKKDINVLLSDNKVIAVMGFVPDQKVRVLNTTSLVYKISIKKSLTKIK